MSKHTQNLNKMANKFKDFKEVEDIGIYDYIQTKDRIEQVFKKYRRYKIKKEIIEERDRSSISLSTLSLENMGIYGTQYGDPVGNNVQKKIDCISYINTIDSMYNIYEHQLSDDEKKIYINYLLHKSTDEQLMDILHINSKSGLYNRKRSCIIKVAIWLDIEVYKDSEQSFDMNLSNTSTSLI